MEEIIEFQKSVLAFASKD